MSSIQPTPAAIEKLFLKPSLTPLIQSEAPNYTSIKLLQDELISNAVSVYSPLGDGDTGHLFLVVSEAEYVLATTSVTVPLGLPRPAPPTAPTSPIVVVPSTGTGTTTRSASSSTPIDNATDAAIAASAAATAATVVASTAETAKLIYKQYLDDKDNHMLYHNTAKCLVKQIVAAVPTIYIEELEHSITKFGKLVPYDLLNHLKQKYGVVSDQDLDANIERMKAKWMPPMPIEALFRQLRKAKQFAKEAGEEIPDTTLCRTGCNNLHATGLFSQYCYEWRMLQPDSSKT